MNNDNQMQEFADAIAQKWLRPEDPVMLDVCSPLCAQVMRELVTLVIAKMRDGGWVKRQVYDQAQQLSEEVAKTWLHYGDPTVVPNTVTDDMRTKLSCIIAAELRAGGWSK